MNMDVFPPESRDEQMERVRRLFNEMTDRDNRKALDRLETVYKSFVEVESRMLPDTDSVRTSVQEFFFYLDAPTELSQDILDRINGILDSNKTLKEEFGELNEGWSGLSPD